MIVVNNVDKIILPFWLFLTCLSAIKNIVTTPSRQPEKQLNLQGDKPKRLLLTPDVTSEDFRHLRAFRCELQKKKQHKQHSTTNYFDSLQAVSDNGEELFLCTSYKRILVIESAACRKSLQRKAQIESYLMLASILTGQFFFSSIKDDLGFVQKMSLMILFLYLSTKLFGLFLFWREQKQCRSYSYAQALAYFDTKQFEPPSSLLAQVVIAKFLLMFVGAALYGAYLLWFFMECCDLARMGYYFELSQEQAQDLYKLGFSGSPLMPLLLCCMFFSIASGIGRKFCSTQAG